ncbi:alpha-glucosidase/alpha-galactosidase [soil metagenome]
MKITLIGVGSFVFGPSAIYDAIVANDLPDLELALVDHNEDVADLMAGVARRLASDVSRDVTVSVHKDWREALGGSDFVCMSAAVDVIGRFQRDSEVIAELYPSHIVTEFGGVAGISYSVRQIDLVTKLAIDMKELCPEALLLMSCNPLARVSEAAQTIGIRTVGFCSNSMKGYGLIGRLLQGWTEEYPWPRAVERYDATMAGANHITFLTSIIDRESGVDVLPDLIAAVHRDPETVGPVTRDLLSASGSLTTNGDDHIRDFLEPTADTHSLTYNVHGGPEERRRRLQMLANVGAGTESIDALLEHRSWESPVTFAAAFAGLADGHFHSLNLPNTGQLRDVLHGVFVETPAMVSKGVITARTVDLPHQARDVTDRTVALSHQIVTAALARDLGNLVACLERDPTVLNLAEATQALRACLAAHADLVGSW